jgi:hypothetical protein
MVKPECQGIADQLQDATSDLAVAQQDFLSEPVNSEVKQRARAEVVRLYNLVQDLERSLRDCEGLPQFPQPVRALFTSTAIVATNIPVFSPTRPSNIQASMTFSSIDYQLVEFSFPDTPVGTSVGGVTGVLTFTNVTSAKTASTVTGAFERSTGHIVMPNARFDVRQSLDAADNGTVNFMPLTTRTVSSPSSPMGTLTGRALDRSVTPGRVVLVGSSVFTGSTFFSGRTVDLII